MTYATRAWHGEDSVKSKPPSAPEANTMCLPLNTSIPPSLSPIEHNVFWFMSAGLWLLCTNASSERAVASAPRTSHYLTPLRMGGRHGRGRDATRTKCKKCLREK